MLLSVALVVFALSLVAAGGVLFLLWQDTGRSLPSVIALLQGQPVSVPSPAPENPDDPLQPDFIVEPALAGDTSELEKQLRDPLRAYYATKPERLKNTVVEKADGAHSTRVTLTLATTQGEEIVTFFYDRSGEDRDGAYPKWGPSMFDNTK